MPRLRQSKKDELEEPEKKVEQPEISADAPVVVTLPENADDEPIVEAAPAPKEPKIEKKEPVKRAAKEPVKEQKKEDETPEEIPGLSDLKAQLEAARAAAEDERKRRIDAEALANKKQEETYRFRNEAEKSQYDMIVNALAGVESEADLAQKEYETAISSGEWDKASKAQRIMSRAEAKLLSLEEGKSAIEARIERAKNEKPQPIKQDPFEQYLNQFSRPTQEWLRDHPQTVKDPRLNAKTIAAHHDAVAEGLIQDTPEYFEYIEEQVGFRKKTADTEEYDNLADAGNGKEIPTKPYSAPPSRESPNATGGKARSSRTVTLTPEQRAAAKASGISDAEYAKHLVALQEEGQLGTPH